MNNEEQKIWDCNSGHFDKNPKLDHVVVVVVGVDDVDVGVHDLHLVDESKVYLVAGSQSYHLPDGLGHYREGDKSIVHVHSSPPSAYACGLEVDTCHRQVLMKDCTSAYTVADVVTVAVATVPAALHIDFPCTV